ncbi:MAG: hypothetical protein LC127_02140 [Chitinophagales bacterium]|nr:hypothetical protein [Chitinophagales bacterium]
MKTLKFLKINFMLIVALLTTGITMSFKMVKEKNASTTYFYNSNDTSSNAFAQVSHYGTTNLEDCITEGDRPCKIIVPEGQTLSNMLSGKNNSQVLAIASQRKP